MITDDSRAYRFLLRSLLVVLAITLIAGVLCIVIVPAYAIWVFAIGAVVTAASLVVLSHLRMRMIFNSLRSRSERSERGLAIAKSEMSDALSEVQQHLARQVYTRHGSLEAELRQRLGDIEREVISNDSFSAGRSADGVNQIALAIRTVESSMADHIESTNTNIAQSLLQLQNSMNVFQDNVFEDLEEVKRRAEDTRTQHGSTRAAVDSIQESFSESFRLQSDRGRAVADKLHDISLSNNRMNLSLRAIENEISDKDRETKKTIREFSSKIVALNESRSAESDTIGIAIGRFEEKFDSHIRSSEENIELGTLAVEEQLTSFAKQLASRSQLADTEAAIERIGKAVLRHLSSGSTDLTRAVAAQIDSLGGTVESSVVRVESAIATETDSLTKRILSEYERVDAILEARLEGADRSSQDRFNALQSKLQQLRVATEELPKDVSDYSSLLDSLRIASTNSPRIGGWAATVPVLVTLVDEIRSREDIENVLDVGSGTSTIWSALAMRDRGFGKCYALEHDKDFAFQLRRQLAELDLTEWAEVVEAPLAPWSPSVEYDLPSERLPDKWYSTYDISDCEFDMVFVDGPPGQFHQYSRLPAMEQLSRQLRTNCLVVLDDTIRVEEREIVEAWMGQDFGDRRLILESQLSKSTVLRLVANVQ